MRNKFKIATRFILVSFGLLFQDLPQSAAQEPITPSGKYVTSLVVPALDYLKEHYDQDRDFGDSALTGLAIFNAGLRQGKNKLELKKDPLLQKILNHVSKEVLEAKPKKGQDIFSVCVTGILLLEVDRLAYEKQIEHVLSYLSECQTSNGAWGSEKDPMVFTKQSQFASLLVWLALAKDFKVKDSTIVNAIDFLVENQDSSGGFVASSKEYKGSLKSAMGSTMAGLASLHTLAFSLRPAGIKYKNYRQLVDAFENGGVWIESNYEGSLKNYPYLFFYGCEQFLSFGRGPTHHAAEKWYSDGAKRLFAEQNGDGSWKGSDRAQEGKIRATSYAILFLVRGTDLLIPRFMDVVEGGFEKLPAKGPLSLKNDGINPADHWIIKYSTSSREAYAKQLDFFRIEIGAVSKDTQAIEYVSWISTDKPVYRKGSRKEEKRAYFQKPANHPALKWDKELLTAAGAKTKNHDICSFYPDRVYQQLFQMEKTVLRREKKESTDVRQTVFIVSPTRDGGYRFMLSKISFK